MRVLPTVTIEIEMRSSDAPNRGGSFSMPLLEARELADRLESSESGELKLGIGGNEFTVTFDRLDERARFVADLRAAAVRRE